MPSFSDAVHACKQDNQRIVIVGNVVADAVHHDTFQKVFRLFGIGDFFAIDLVLELVKNLFGCGHAHIGGEHRFFKFLVKVVIESASRKRRENLFADIVFRLFKTFFKFAEKSHIISSPSLRTSTLRTS